MTDKNLPSIDLLNKVLRLEAGALIWRERHVDMTQPIRIDGKSVSISDALYALTHGEWPAKETGRLRYQRHEVTDGVVFPRIPMQRWSAETEINGRKITLGVYDTADEAKKAIKKVRQAKGLE